MEMGVRKLPKKRKFDPSELEDNNTTSVCIPVPVVQSAPQSTAVDYSCTTRTVQDDTFKHTSSTKQVFVDLSEWIGHRVLAKQGDWFYQGVIQSANGSNVSQKVLQSYCFHSTKLCSFKIYS